jgi:hypothetical protein
MCNYAAAVAAIDMRGWRLSDGDIMYFNNETFIDFL